MLHVTSSLNRAQLTQHHVQVSQALRTLAAASAAAEEEGRRREEAHEQAMLKLQVVLITFLLLRGGH